MRDDQSATQTALRSLMHDLGQGLPLMIARLLTIEHHNMCMRLNSPVTGKTQLRNKSATLYTPIAGDVRHIVDDQVSRNDREFVSVLDEALKIRTMIYQLL